VRDGLVAEQRRDAQDETEEEQLDGDGACPLPPIRTTEQRMKTPARPASVIRARCRRTGSFARFPPCRDIATTAKPVIVAAPPPTVEKKSCHCAGS
jgi:hypothetical protein